MSSRACFKFLNGCMISIGLTRIKNVRKNAQKKTYLKMCFVFKYSTTTITC